MDYTIEEFISEKVIKENVRKIAENITEGNNEEEISLITVLEGARTFSDDIIAEVKNIKPSLKVNNYFVKLSSYGSGTVSSGKVKINKDIDFDIENKNVIIMEDLIDTGNTLNFLRNYLLENKKVKSVKICTFLDKPSRREVEVPVDYKGIEIPDEFVVGYGMDYTEKHRDLSYIGIVKFKE